MVCYQGRRQGDETWERGHNERRRGEIPRGVWGHAPAKNFSSLGSLKCYF